MKPAYRYGIPKGMPPPASGNSEIDLQNTMNHLIPDPVARNKEILRFLRQPVEAGLTRTFEPFSFVWCDGIEHLGG